MYTFNTYTITYQPTDASYRDFETVEVIAFSSSDAVGIFELEFAGQFTFIESVEGI